MFILKGAIGFYLFFFFFLTAFTDLQLARGSQDQCKAKGIGFFTHTVGLNRMNFDVGYEAELYVGCLACIVTFMNQFDAKLV